MSRSQGVFTLPPGYRAVSGQTIKASQHNPALESIAQALTNSIPRDGTAPMLGNLPLGGNRVTGMATGIDLTDAATVAQMRELGVPIGTCHDFAGSQPPTGYLLCYGQSVARADYPDLFDVIGTTFGSESDTTFTLPDYRGRIGIGKDNMGGSAADRITGATVSPNGNTLGATGGEEEHELTAAENGPHDHDAGSLEATRNGEHRHNVGGSNNAAGTGSTGDYVTNFPGADNSVTSFNGEHDHNVAGSTANSGSGEPHNNVQPSVIVNKIVKAFHP